MHCVRGWIRSAMAARNVAASDVYNGWANNTYGGGQPKARWSPWISPRTRICTPWTVFRQLIVRQQNSTVCVLEDVATVELGAED